MLVPCVVGVLSSASCKAVSASYLCRFFYDQPIRESRDSKLAAGFGPSDLPQPESCAQLEPE